MTMAAKKSAPKKDTNLKAEKPTPTSKGPAKSSSGGKLLALLLGVGVLAFVIALVGFEYFQSRDSQTADGAAVQSSGAPAVGGPFELTNHFGEAVTEKDFAGQYMLVFFGYTYCPDVCPTALSDMSVALDLLGEEKAEKITPLFISVDPARDTPDHLAEYVSFFHPKTIGLTGTEEQIKKVAREYRVYYRLNEPSADDPLDYLVDHTGIVYLMGPDGKLVTHFSHGTPPDKMAERLGQLL
jgi:protein SCO1/2